MAELNAGSDSDDELPCLSTLLWSGAATIAPTTPSEKQRSTIDRSQLPRKDTGHERDSQAGQCNVASRQIFDASPQDKPVVKQRPLGSLKVTSVNSLLLPKSNGLLDRTEYMKSTGEFPTANHRNRSSPRRLAKAPVDYSKFATSLSEASISLSDDDETTTDLSGFIVSDSTSEEEVLPSKSRRRRDGQQLSTVHAIGSKNEPLISPKKSAFRRLDSSGAPEMCPESQKGSRTPPSSSTFIGINSDTAEPFSELKFSPPRSKSPHKPRDDFRPHTPPLIPSKTVFQSPSKSNRIPPSPHKPSIDAFWSQQVINDWNEQYSPKKTLKSPRKFCFQSVDGEDGGLSPSESPRRSPIRSPAKKDKEAVLLRKAFNDRKHDMATSFLAEIDQTIVGGQVSAMAESTGGIKLIWSKKLTSTAGRANWRREAVRSKSADGTVSTNSHRHHASIELAEKVIDDEERLLNVIAHEYCHLANFMISGIKDNPHGKEFKEWASKCTKAFSHRNITVTTKHTYTIAYKYVWVCETCETEYKRHSKSIDPAKHTCGKCKGKLVQVQPAPRKGQSEGKRSEYQDFVKKEHERVKLENPGKGFGERMAILGREFRESKKAGGVGEGAKEKQLASKVPKQEEDDDDIDAVVRKLDFVHLTE